MGSMSIIYFWPGVISKGHQHARIHWHLRRQKLRVIYWLQNLRDVFADQQKEPLPAQESFSQEDLAESHQ